MRKVASPIAVFVLTALSAASCLAQTESDSKSAGEPTVVTQSFQFAGFGQNIRDKWGIVGARLRNPTDTAVDVLSTLYFPENPNLQFARQVWVPPRSLRVASFPAKTTGNVPPRAVQITAKTMLLDRSSRGGETVLKSESGEMLGDALLSTQDEPIVTGVISDNRDTEAFDAVVAMRLSRSLTRRLSSLSDDFLPPFDDCLEGMDQIVLMSDAQLRDAASLASLRRWLEDGGRLWITLDKVESATVSALLGDAFEHQVVDRVGLTHFTIEGKSRSPEHPTPTLSIETDRPIDFVRVLTDKVDVMYTVDGWPAAFFLEVGRGRVLFTSLGARAWLRPVMDRERRPDPLRSANQLATVLFAEMSSRFSAATPPPALPPEEFQDFVSEQIGYRIIGRGSVMLVLGLFCAGLAGIGAWSFRGGRPEQMGWIGPVVASGAAILLAMMGYGSQHAVPATLAVGQMVEIAPRLNDISISGLLASYDQRETDGLGAQQGGIFIPETAGASGTVHRIVWTDLDRWHWENLTLPSGLNSMPFRMSRTTEDPIRVRATFGPSGMVGTIRSEPFRNLADALICFPGCASLAPRLNSDGSFVGGVDAALEAGVFQTSNIFSDEQRRRAAVYRKLLGTQRNGKYPEHPTLFVWADPMETHFTFPEEMRPVGSALLAIAVEFERPDPGTRFLIPSSCMMFDSVGRSSAYDDAEKKWVERLAEARTTVLRFQVPRGILPVRLDRAILTLDIDAPSRSLEVTVGSGNDAKIVTTHKSPIGRVRIEIDQAENFALDDTGGLFVGVNVGPTGSDSLRGKGPAMLWKIDNVQLEVAGEALEP